MKTRYFLGLPFVTLNVGIKEIEAIIDTGFNGALLLPQEIIKEIKLKKIGVSDYIMADGTTSETELYLSEIEWIGKKKKVTVVSSSSDIALVGMELLYDSKITLSPSEEILTIESIKSSNKEE